MSSYRFNGELPPGTPESVVIRGISVAVRHDGLHAITRGPCPFSPTGYYSWSGFKHLDEASLEARAVQHDNDTADTLRRVKKACRVAPAQPHETPLFRFLTHSGAADKAIQYGIFAPDAVRAELWRHARRVLELILATPDIQPSTNHAWTPEICAEKLRLVAATLAGLSAAMKGDVDALRASEMWSVKAYLELAPRPTPEPVIPPIVETDAFGFAADSSLEIRTPDDDRDTDSEDDDGERDDDTAEAEKRDSVPADTEQLQLF